MPFKLIPSDLQTELQAAPVPAVLNGTLHLVVADLNGMLFHCQYDDLRQLWTVYSGVASSVPYAGQPTCVVFDSTQLWCAFRQGSNTPGLIYACSWNGYSGWNGPTLASFAPVEYDPGLVVIDQKLWLFDTKSDVHKTIFKLQYSATSKSCSKVSTISQSANGGVSITGAATRSFFTFPNKTTNTVTVCELIGVNWEVSRDLGLVCLGKLLDDTASVVWTDSQTTVLHFASRLVIPKLQLDRWMSYLPASTPTAALIISRTHNSAAMSSIPLVACQKMTVIQQLVAGIKYLDFRGEFLYGSKIIRVYHGIYYIGLIYEDVFRKSIAGCSSKNMRKKAYFCRSNRTSSDSARSPSLVMNSTT